MSLLLLLLIGFSHAGVIIVDNVWFYGNDGKTRILATGDLVEIIGKEDDFVKVNYDNTTGTVRKDILIDLSELIAEDQLFVFSRGYYDEREYRKSVRLFDIFTKNFSKSDYLAEALYCEGLSYEGMAKNYNKSDSIQHITFNRKNNTWFFEGNAYQTILNQFPKSIYAPKAAFQLIKIFRMKNIPWKDSISPIQEELRMWREFITKYKKCEEYVMALLEIGYLNRVLYQVTKDLKFENDAVEIFQKVLKEYPNSVYSAQAKINLYEIENNIDTYSY